MWNEMRISCLIPGCQLFISYFVRLCNTFCENVSDGFVSNFLLCCCVLISEVLTFCLLTNEMLNEMTGWTERRRFVQK